MKEFIVKELKTIKNALFDMKADFVRVFIIGLFIVALQMIDGKLQLDGSISYLSALLSSTSIILIVAVGSHLLRRLMFPSVHLQRLVAKSEEHPIGAAISFFGFCLILSVFIIGNILLL